jgi:hypothetical protein
MSTNRAALATMCESEYSHLQIAMRAPAHLGSKSLNLRFALMRLPRERRSAMRNGLCHGSPAGATNRTGETTFGHPFSRSSLWDEAPLWPPRSCSSSVPAPRERARPNGQQQSASETACSALPGSPARLVFAARSGPKTRPRPAIPGSTRWPTNRRPNALALPVSDRFRYGVVLGSVMTSAGERGCTGDAWLQPRNAPVMDVRPIAPARLMNISLPPAAAGTLRAWGPLHRIPAGSPGAGRAGGTCGESSGDDAAATT